MILETVSPAKPRLSPKPRFKTEDAGYRHKQSLISGIYGKQSADKLSSPRKSFTTSSVADKHIAALAAPQLSDSGDSEDDDEEESDSSGSSSSICSEARLSPPPSITEPATSCSNDIICDNPAPLAPTLAPLATTDSSGSEDSLPPPFLEPQISESLNRKSSKSTKLNKSVKQVKHNSSKSSAKRKYVRGSQAKNKLSLDSPSSSSNCASPSPPLDLVDHSPPVTHSYSTNNAPPLLLGHGPSALKHNRGRPRKNPPTLQPQTSSYSQDNDVPGEPMSVDNSAEESSDNVKEKKRKKGKLSVLFNAAKHWQKTHDLKNSNDKVYDFNEEPSDDNVKSSDEEDDDSNCDTKHSKVLKTKGRKSKHKTAVAAPEPLKKYKCLTGSSKSKKLTNKCPPLSSDDDAIQMFNKKRSEDYSRPSSSISNLTGDESYRKIHQESGKSRKKTDGKRISKNAGESDASSCFEEGSSRSAKAEIKPVYQQFSTKVSTHFGKTGGLIFAKKYCTLKPDAFWKDSSSKVEEAKTEVEYKQEQHSGDRIATKASLKEMPNVARNQVQQMLSVLAAASKPPTKTTKKKKVKEEKKAFTPEPVYDTQSEDEDGFKRKSKKGWKSKYKNIVDPVFLGELEHLIRDIASVQVEIKPSKHLWPDRPSDSVPSIFKRRKIIGNKKKRDSSKLSRRGKTSKPPTHTAEQKKSIEILDLTGESDEQRLPLKKRHHHHVPGSQGNIELNTSYEDIEVEPINPAQALIQVKTPEKIIREFSKNSSTIKHNDGTFQSERKQSIQSGGVGKIILQDKLVKKPTAADRIVEKLGIQIKRENSNCSGGNDSRVGVRRISKEYLGTTSGSGSHSNSNSSKDQRTNKPTSGSDQNRSLANIQIKSETKLKQSRQPEASESTFVDNIQDCIDKYTASSSRGGQRHQVENRECHFDRKQEAYDRGNFAPVLSSPEPEPDIPTSGRDSSLSQHSNSSDCCIIEDSSGSSKNNASRVGRSSRQDLHSHLWRQESHHSPDQYQNVPSFHRGLEHQQHQQVHHSHPSKPLPTEPIRRVDLGGRPLGSSFKPGFLSNQECVIRKVPQAIVAPFRRNPPESTSTPASQVVPIHRASISHSTETSSLPSTSTTTTTTSSIAAPSEPVPAPAVVEQTEDKDQEVEQKLDEPPQLEVRDLQHANIRKCQVAVERLKSVAVDSEVSKKPLSNDSKVDHPTRSTLSQHKSIQSTTHNENREKSGEKSSDSTLNIVSKDKSTKENKCSSKNLENEISNKKRVENNFSQASKLSKEPGQELENNDQDATLVMKNSSQEDNASQVVHNEILPDPKIVSKKRKRRKTNKTGFPCKIKKKKKIASPPVESQVVEKSLHSDENQPISELSKSRNLAASKLKGGIFDNLETFKISAANIDLDGGRHTSSGRPMRECRSQEAKPEQANEQENDEIKPSKSKKRAHSPERRNREGRRTKRPRPSTSNHSPFKRTPSSSCNPSPASSDVESIDTRSYLDDAETDTGTDYLTGLPCLEDNLLSPSIAESSELHTSDSAEKRKKVKRASSSSFIVKKNNFLKAGLFSHDYKSEGSEGKVSGSGGESLLRNKGLMYKPEEHPFSLLPPPYYCGRQLRQKREDFALPFDLWSLHSTNSLPNRDILATWNYKRIKSNIYYDVKSTVSFDTPACHCKPPSEADKPYCGSKCLNRMTYTECDPESCPLGDKCSNMVIQKQKSTVVVQRFIAGEKGFGIKTKNYIPKGTFIMEYLGEVVTDKEFKRRMQTDYQKDSHHYCLHVGEGLVIDGYRMGGECRFVNHSCAPNCEMQKWSVNGMWRMALFSKVPIDVNEELTYDYNFSWFNTHEGQTCHCGSEQCRGVIGGKGKKTQAKLNGGKTAAVAGKSNKESKSSKQQECSSKDEKVSRQQQHQGGKSEQKTSSKSSSNGGAELLNRSNLNHFASLKPMTSAQQSFCRKHSVLLLRNLEKIRKLRDLYLNPGNFSSSITRVDSARKTSNKRAPPATSVQVEEETQNPSPGDKSKEVSSEQPLVKDLPQPVTTSTNSVQTRLSVFPVESTDTSKLEQIVGAFFEILESLTELQDKDGQNVIKHFMSSPSREECPEYYNKLSEPIDISSIKQGLESASYNSPAHIDQDFLLLFQNNIRYYGFNSPLGRAAKLLRKKYFELTEERKEQFGGVTLTRPEPMVTDEDIINCGCGQYKDEGVMIQCDQCQCWQHTDCVNPDLDPETVDQWSCDQCSHAHHGHPTDQLPRDIALVPQPEFASPGETYYVSMVREDGMQLVLGMTVYVLRAFKDTGASSSRLSPVKTAEETDKITVGHGGVPHKSISPIKGPSKEAATLLPGNYPTYKTAASTSSTQDMDIFRVERLWTNEAGQKFAFGYHYLRPHETFHEPSRKFYDNEVFRVPLYEVLPLDTIWRQCWVMDPATFCR